MSYRVVIVDDEKPARDRIRRMLSEHPDFSLVGEAGDVASAAELIDREQPDVCFLDVRMPGGEGFDVLRKVAHVPKIVFTTAYDEYAVRAFEVNSLDYLLKPFDKSRFKAALERIRETLGGEKPSGETIVDLLEQIRAGLPQERSDRIPGRRGTRIILLDPAEVLFFEAEETLVFARTVEGKFLVDRTLAELESPLERSFFRCHRSHLVNLAHVGEILPEEAGTYRIVLKDEARTVVPLSRRQARKLRERIPW
jgi:DNA-binding LytR/AlgR family response regulator